MKTFGQFLSIKESGVLDVDRADDAGGGGGIMRALTVAAQDNESEVISFLQRLAKQNPDIQLELDKMNHENGNQKPSRKKARLGRSHDHNGEGDVVVPNSADSSHGDMPE